MSRWISAMIFACLFTSLIAQQSLVRTFVNKDDVLTDECVTRDIPVDQRDPGPVVTPTRNAVMIQDVPAFDWCYGCGATSAAMLAGYWDRKGYSNIYTGPANGGVMPLNNSIWGTGECPLSATHTGVDGLSTAGHVNRFWVSSGSSGNDPFGTGNPTGTYADCTADYIGTSQDWWYNVDGSTHYRAGLLGEEYHDWTICETYTPRRKDMMHGLRQFFESRGYVVTDNYTQRIVGWNGNTGGFSFAKYMTYIDAGIPVIIFVDGHIMLGVGYDSASSTVYLHNTWDYGLHSMTWGGSYSGMGHIAMGVLTLAPITLACSPSSLIQTMGQNTTASQNLSISNPGAQPLNYTCTIQAASEVMLDETFPTTSLPAGWTQSYTTGTNSWIIATGGYTNNYPPAAFDGAYNARLWMYGTSSETKLITPSMNLSTSGSATLTFYHAQTAFSNPIPPNTPYQDKLSVYYRTSSSGNWTLLSTYPYEITGWQQETIALPNLSTTYYIAFGGYTNQGAGICLDKVVVTKKSPTTNWLSFNGAQTYTGNVAIGGSPSTVPVTFNTTGLTAGAYTTTIVASNPSATNNPITVPVTLQVTSTESTFITSPSTGVVWQGGTNQNITWTYYGTCSSVQLQFWGQGIGLADIATVPTVFGTNSYTWTVPYVISYTSRIVITDGVWPAFWTIYSGYFSIVSPSISVNQTSLNMGLVQVNSTTTASFNISNPGAGVLSGNITTPAGFSVALSRGNSESERADFTLAEDLAEQTRNTLAYSVPAGANQNFTLTFAPTAMQAYNGNVTITHNAGGASKTIAVTGQGMKSTLVSSVSTLTFNSLQHLPTNQIFTISNTGNMPLSYTLSIPDSITWMLVNLAATLSNTIEVGGAAQDISALVVSNTFNQGTYYAVINGTSNDPNMLTFSIPITVNLTGPITISSPTGGESIACGAVKTITWNYDNPYAEEGTIIRISYTRSTGPTFVWTTITTLPYHQGENSIQWTVPTVLSNTLFRIRVAENTFPYLGHDTDTFTVTAGPPVAPVNLQVFFVDGINGDLYLTWGYSPGTISGFKVYSCPNSNFAPEDTTLLGTSYGTLWIIPAQDVMDHQFFRVTAFREP